MATKLTLHALSFRWIVWASQMGALCLSLWISACGPEDKNAVPVDLRVGYRQTASSEPVRVEIYEYINPDSQPYDFRVTSEPPLSFVFPARYYADTESIEGGPVSRMDLAFDRKTWQPWATAFSRQRHGLPHSESEDLDRRLRFLHISVHSNISWIAWPRGHARKFLEFKRAKMIGSFNGFDLYSYAEPSDRAVEPLPPLIFDGIDFNGNNTIVGISQNQELERYLHCHKIGRCVYYFTYRERIVEITINKFDLPSAGEIESKLTTILDSHLVGGGS